MNNEIKAKLDKLTPEQRRQLNERLKNNLDLEAQPKIAKIAPGTNNIALSPQQRRLWTLYQFSPDSTEYNIPGVFKVSGPLNLEKLRTSFELLTRRHEILRTNFEISSSDEVNQKINAVIELPFYTSSVDKKIRDEALESLVKEKIAVRFNMSEGPLWRVEILELKVNEYLLILSMHHIIFDGWSLGVLVKEVFNYYQRLLRGEPVTAEELAIQYKDFSHWLNKKITKEQYIMQEFWKGYLNESPPALELPFDNTRELINDFSGAMHELVLPKTLLSDVKNYAQQHGATPFNFFLSVLNVLIHRYSGAKDIIIGTPVSGRDEKETHDLLGIFVNTVPVRLNLSADDNFTDVLKAVRASALSAFEYSHMPFDAIVESVNPERIPGCNPIFQVLYTYQNMIPPIQNADLTIAYQSIDTGTSKFDLSLDVFESANGISCLFEYNDSLFTAEKIIRLAQHFEKIVKYVLEHSETKIKQIDYLSDSEKNLALATVLQEKYLPNPETLTDLFDRQALQKPDSDCVIFQGVRLTYKQVYDLSHQLASVIVDYKQTSNAVVAVCMQRTEKLIPLLLAILKSGCAFVVLDPNHPQERLKYMVEDSSADLVIYDDTSETPVIEWRTKQVSYSALLEKSLDSNSEAFQSQARVDGDAYVIYTSGTTGQPKAIKITHNNCFNAFYGWQETYSLNEITSHLQMANLTFDVFCGDFIRCIGSGSKMVICPQQILASPSELFHLIKTETVEFAEFVPAVFRELTEWLLTHELVLNSMKVLVVASDAWYQKECLKYINVCGEKTRLINSYGMAEATIDSTWFDVTSAYRSDKQNSHAKSSKLVPIGKPFANVEVLVLDDNQQLMPPGIPGEICVSGYGVAKAYLNREALSQDKFIKHPYLEKADYPLYRTGDVGILNTSGELELRGRKDHQIKIRGQRIDLAEIETALSKFENIQQVIANVFQESDHQKYIVAYYLASDVLDENQMRVHLKNWIPTYMMPSYFVHLNEIPLSNNGKVNRKALKKPDVSGDSLESTFVSPSTLVQEILANIWCQVMRLPRVGIYDSFFELGGHSLLAFQVIARIDDSLKVKLPLHSLFTHPTVAQLEELIKDFKKSGRDEALPKAALPLIIADPQNRYKPFPLTEVQQAYWLGRNEAFELGNVSTHSYDEMEIKNFDLARFQRAWNKVIQRHDMLRAIINDDGTQQVIENVPEYQVVFEDLKTASESEIERNILKVRNELSHKQLNVHQWPVFDIRALLLPDGKGRLHFSTDALMWDVWSFVILIKDMMRFYIDEALSVDLPEITFRDYVIAERELINGEDYKQSIAYWSQRAAHLPRSPQLPMAKDPGSLAEPKFTRFHSVMEKELWDQLKLKATKYGMTSTGITLAAYAEILKRYSQEPAFSLNLTFLNRHPLHARVNDIVGEFTSITLLAIDDTSDACFVDRARKIQSDLWHDLEHHFISGIHVLRELTKHHGGATRSKMPVVFTSALVVPIPEDNSEFQSTMKYSEGVTQTSQVWLDCGVWEDKGRLLCNFDVVLDVYPEGLIPEMFDAYCELLHQLASGDEAWNHCISELSSIKTEEKPIALLPPAIEESLVSLFINQVEKTPANIAVLSTDKTLTYQQLMAHVIVLQNRILEENSDMTSNNSGKLIAVIMDKGWEQSVATLAIMAAGYAYVPIDPTLPQERIAYLLECCDIEKVITQPHCLSMVKQHGDFQVYVVNEDIDFSGQFSGLRRLNTQCLPKTDQLAYVIFTSGSTGLPKGVMIDHAGAVNTILDINERFHISSKDKILAVSALNFDLSVYDLFGIFAIGASIVFPDNERRLDPTHWLELIVRHQVTLWNTVPALTSILLDYAESVKQKLSWMRCIMMSGDWIPLNLPERLKKYCPQSEVISLGGATEASIWSILYPIESVDQNWKSIPYGKAMKNQSMHILDYQLSPCPVWVTGEIYIGGIGLAMGYWKDEEKTKRSFITHPETGARLYRTGDLGRLLPDGNIEILGRTDFQVKIQGHRIELGEIEATIMQNHSVKETVIIAVGKDKGNKSLLGYVVAKEGQAFSIELLQAYLRAKLPLYMVPSLIEIPHIPLSANGKVDRNALAELSNNTLTKSERVEPSSALEKSLHKIWSSLLNRVDFGIDDDFFAAGGDSMMVVHLITQLKIELSVSLTLNQLFLNRTIREQAALCEKGSMKCEQRDDLVVS
jgi:amino acid adenylation domain-containing protein